MDDADKLLLQHLLLHAENHRVLEMYASMRLQQPERGKMEVYEEIAETFNRPTDSIRRLLRKTHFNFTCKIDRLANRSLADLP
jgi:hypothetical protein